MAVMALTRSQTRVTYLDGQAFFKFYLLLSQHFSPPENRDYDF
jgi:hypothetical protein